jgi:nitrite reductase/ring-hydroxylating ferredoxin subunit
MPETDLDGALLRLERLVGTFESEPDDALRERVFELLEAVDAVHRPLVWAVAERIHREQPELFESLLEDPVGSVLFEMYGLVSPRRRGDGGETERPAAFVGLDDLLSTVPQPLTWRRVAAVEDVGEGALVGAGIDGERVAAVRVDGGLHVYRDACPGTPMPISAGSVRGATVLCPWHDCRFDLRTGRRLDREGPGLDELPLDVRAGVLHVGLRLAGDSAA